MSNTNERLRWIYGVHSVVHAILSGRAQDVYVQKKRLLPPALQHALKLKNKTVIEWSSSRFQKQFGAEAVHQGLAAYCLPLVLYEINALPNLLNSAVSPVILILDQITDPRNFGACLRCAEAAGVNLVIIPQRNASALSAAMAKVASGAIENLSLVRVSSLHKCLKVLKQAKITCIATSDKAQKNLYEHRWSFPCALLMGSEDKGLGNSIMDECDDLIKIPMAGKVESLNVSAATAVCLFEAHRQYKKR